MLSQNSRRPPLQPFALVEMRDMRHNTYCPHKSCNDCKNKDAAIEAVSDLIEEAGFLLRDLDSAAGLQPDTIDRFRAAYLAAVGA